LKRDVQPTCSFSVSPLSCYCCCCRSYCSYCSYWQPAQSPHCAHLPAASAIEIRAGQEEWVSIRARPTHRIRRAQPQPDRLLSRRRRRGSSFLSPSRQTETLDQAHAPSGSGVSPMTMKEGSLQRVRGGSGAAPVLFHTHARTASASASARCCVLVTSLLTYCSSTKQTTHATTSAISQSLELAASTPTRRACSVCVFVRLSVNSAKLIELHVSDGGEDQGAEEALWGNRESFSSLLEAVSCVSGSPFSRSDSRPQTWNDERRQR